MEKNMEATIHYVGFRLRMAGRERRKERITRCELARRIV